MNIWELLGIPPTSEIAKIKSAYARQAKLCHPEEHPEEFKQLQKAYKTALQMAKSGVWTAGMLPVQSPQEKNAEDAGKQTKQAEYKQEESSFDYSDVDAYGDRERFFKQFPLLAKNPYLRNNLHTWEYFLHLDVYEKLFENTNFRTRFVKTLCGVVGWRRKTILYFQKFLLSFHKDENVPVDGKWETDVWRFRLKKLPHLRLPAFFMDRFWGKEGRTFYKQLHAKISREMGRELDLSMKPDLIRYLKLYLFYAESNEDYVEHLHKGWKVQQALWAAAGVLVCLVLALAYSISVERERQAKEDTIRIDYLMELYDLEAGSCSKEELQELLRDYETYWGYAEEAIDDVLGRYENWFYVE